MKPTTRLFVANLPDDIKDEELVAEFSVFGKVTNIDLNIKTEAGKECTKFAFVTLSAPRIDVESCIQHFTNEDYHGTRLYVTIARESFLEKLQREQREADDKVKFMCQESFHKKNRVRSLSDKMNSEMLNRTAKWSWRTSQHCHYMHHQNIVQIPIINLSEKLNPRKRKIEQYQTTESALKTIKHKQGKVVNEVTKNKYSAGVPNNKMKTTRFACADRKKREAKNKILESIKQGQNFKDKRTITTTFTSAQDELQKKRLIFPDFEELQKKLKEKEKKVSRQVTIHWIRVYQNTRILHRHKQDLMHSHNNISLTSFL